MIKGILFIFDKITEMLIASMFLIMVILLFAQVIARYIFDFPVMWSEEVGRYLYIWIVYLAASLAFRDKKHLIVDILISKLKYSLRVKWVFTIYILIIIFLSFVFIYGFQYAKINWALFAHSTRLIKLGWAYAAIPVGSLFMIINITRLLPELLKKDSDIKK